MAGVLLGLAGPPGSGKGKIAEQLSILGVDVFNVGDVVRATAHANGFEPEGSKREDYLPFWREYSQEHGEDWIAKLALARQLEIDEPVAVDGVRIPADARTIAANGLMVWLHTDLRTAAKHAIARGRKEDQDISVEEHVEAMERDLSDTGNFSMGLVRELCTVQLLPAPEIEDEVERAVYYNGVALSLLRVTRGKPNQAGLF